MSTEFIVFIVVGVVVIFGLGFERMAHRPQRRISPQRRNDGLDDDGDT